MNKRVWIGVGLAAALLVGWAIFRPELFARESNGFRRISRSASVGGSRITDATAVVFRPVQGICPSD